MAQENDSLIDREWLKFALLGAILFVVVLVVALSRPFLFNRVVPAVMGEDMTAVPESAEPTEPTPQATAPAAGTGGETAATAVPSSTPMPTATITVDADTPTAVPTITHVVQRGENITRIARSYNVSVADIVAANNIANPNHIEAGTVLAIPQP